MGSQDLTPSYFSFYFCKEICWILLPPSQRRIIPDASGPADLCGIEQHPCDHGEIRNEGEKIREDKHGREALLWQGRRNLAAANARLNGFGGELWRGVTGSHTSGWPPVSPGKFPRWLTGEPCTAGCPPAAGLRALGWPLVIYFLIQKLKKPRFCLN